MPGTEDIWIGSVERLAWGGLGLGREDDGRLVLLNAPLALFPGEVVTAQIKRKTKHSQGEVLAWQEASPHRVEPACPYARECGGCALWGAGVHTGQLKHLMVKDLLARQLPSAPDNWKWIPAPSTAKRQRIQLHWDGRALGYHAPGSHRLVPVQACPMAEDALVAAIPVLAEALTVGVLPSSPARWELATGTPSLVVVAVCGNILGRSWALSTAGWREPASMLEHEIADKRMVQSPGAFFQACTSWATEALRGVLHDWEVAGKTLYDLYGGGGLFSCLLTERFKEFVLVESGVLALNDAKHNLDNMTASIIDSPVERWLKPGIGESDDVIILDPPRAGLGRAICESLKQSGAGRIVLCGCDGAAFCRDVQMLTPHWRLNRLTVIDLFPNTPQVECVGELVPVV